MTLQLLRKRIDRIDLKILALLNQRATVSARVGQIKKKQGQPVFDGRREKQILRRLRAANGGPLPRGAVEKIFREVLRASRRLATSSQRASS